MGVQLRICVCEWVGGWVEDACRSVCLDVVHDCKRLTKLSIT